MTVMNKDKLAPRQPSERPANYNEVLVKVTDGGGWLHGVYNEIRDAVDTGEHYCYWCEIELWHMLPEATR